MTKIRLALDNYIGGAGKSSIANYLCEKHGFHQYALADGIYTIARDVFGMKQKERPLLHHIGEKLREYDKMVWINETLRRVENDNHDRVVITDVRKLLEYAYLLEHDWEHVMVYCPPEVALQRLKERDGEDNVNEDLVLNSPLENQLHPLRDSVKLIDTSQTWEDTKKEIDLYIKSLERKNK